MTFGEWLISDDCEARECATQLQLARDSDQPALHMAARCAFEGGRKAGMKEAMLRLTRIVLRERDSDV